MWTVDYSSLTTKCADSTTNTYSYWTARCKQYTSVLAQPLHYTITTRWLYCVECPQYSIRLEAFRYRCTSCYFLHSTRPSVTWLSSLWWLAACDWVMSALSAMLSTRQTLQKIWEVSCVECTDQGNDFRLIPVVKMETRNPIEGYFGSKFPAICNHCGVMDAWSRNTLKFWDIFVFFSRKTTHYCKIFKILFRKFSSQHRLMYCVQILWNSGRWEIGEIVCVAYLPKKLSPGSPALATARIAPQICQGQPPTVLKSAPNYQNWFAFGTVLAERMNTAKTCCKVNPIFGWSLASSWIITGCHSDYSARS